MKNDIYIKEGSRILSGLPSVAWLLVALGVTVILMHYFPLSQAILGVVTTILLFAIGKWFGLSKEEVITLMSVPTDQAPEGAAGAPAVEEVEVEAVKTSRLSRLLF